MDPADRRSIEKYGGLIKRLNIDILKPHLINSRIFTFSMLEDIFNSNTDVDLLSELPSRGPLAFSRFLKVLCDAGYETESNIIRNGTDCDDESVFYYPMKSQPLGYCIIINNINFYDNGEEIEKMKREGSRVDAKLIRQLFDDELGYAVEEQINLTKESMKEYLISLAKSKVMQIVDCCFVFILSHGSYDDVLFDTRCSEFRKQEIYDIFNNINCEYLRKKPKVIIFQSCRGKVKDDGISSVKSSYPELPLNNNFSAASTPDNAQSVIYSNNAIESPLFNDFLIIHSSLPDHVSYLDKYKGSWLMEDLVNVFTECYLCQDIESMLKTVSRKIQDRLSLDEKKKQVLHIESGLRGLLHICSNDAYKGPKRDFIRYLA